MQNVITLILAFIGVMLAIGAIIISFQALGFLLSLPIWVFILAFVGYILWPFSFKINDKN